MKKWVSLLLVAALFLGLCGCSGIKLVETGGKDSSASSAVSSETSSEVSEDSTSAETQPDFSVATEAVGDFLSIAETETEYGLIRLPQFNETTLNSEDARKANALFQSILDWLLERVEAREQEADEESYHDAAVPLCVTRYTQTGNMLSVVVQYIGLFPDSVERHFVDTVTLDTSTGEALDHLTVFRAAGFTEEEVKAALRRYACSFMLYEWEHDVFESCAEDGVLPDGLGDPTYGWQEELDDIVDFYDVTAVPSDVPWYGLPLDPRVYAGEDGLEVCVRVPTEVDVGFYDAMVRIGRNDAETTLWNPNTPVGEPFGRSAMMDYVACEIVARSLGLNEDYTDIDGVQYSLGADSMELLDHGEGAEPAYVIRLYTDEGDHVATVGWYAVGVFTGHQWEMDITSGDWTPMMSGTGLLPEELVTGAMSNGALASVWDEQSGYGSWVANPRTEVDLIALESGAEFYESIGDTLLLFALQDDTVFSFEIWPEDSDGTITKKQLWSLTLNTGECVSVLYDRYEMTPQVICVNTPDDAGSYVIPRLDPDSTSLFDYITPDSAVG